MPGLGRQSKLNSQLDGSDGFVAEMSSKILRHWGHRGALVDDVFLSLSRYLDILILVAPGSTCVIHMALGTPSLIPFLTWTKLGKRRCQKKGTVTWTEVPDQVGSGVLNQRPPWTSQ